ncbi:type VI secretion system ATPase TssH [Serratia marcescens]|uniref:type VI secretion system ATPase TssH n=1 Tax=Serratia marcescens TaxID=615 RepID=UPI0002B85E67|nr:type VI secretion system ATPase TssH [Serratia marcescens]EMF07036.1 type VI secretion ATPase, ClpV1 family protein [Serratia marcescens VGH107]
MNHHLKSIIGKLSGESRAALDTAINHAASQHHGDITPEHLLLAIVSQESTLLKSLELQAGLPVSNLFDVLEKTLEQTNTRKTTTPVFTAKLVQWFVNSWQMASARWDQQQLSPAAMIACLFDDDDDEAFFYPLVQQALRCDRQLARQLLQADPYKGNGTPVTNTMLAKYTRNLSEQARQSKLDPVLGRESEIRQIVDILLRRRQNNPILTGEPGVGKTALVEGLAIRIAEGSVPRSLKSMEVLTLDLGLLQAGASVKGEFENRLQSLLKEVACNPKPIILFIDEAHTLIGAGGQVGQNDAANLLKPSLARGELRVIAATTWVEYKKYFEKDAALTRRFQVVKVAEPTIENAIIMLRAITPAMSLHHDVPVLESAIHAAVNLSNRYISGRHLPDKSVSLLDTACARVAVSQTHEPKEIEALAVQLRAINSEKDSLERENSAPEHQLKLTQQAVTLQTTLDTLREEWQHQISLVQQLVQSQDASEIASKREALAARHQQHAMVFECVDATCVADVVSDWTGIPLGRMLEKEHQQLDALFDRLAERIIGQQYALKQIAQQIRINRAGMGDPLKPTGVFLLAGPSGIGKTETALALAELLFGGEQNLVTINMSEYQEAHSVSGLKGSPPGYVGYGQGGVLTEAVCRTPYSVVLLDEIEKAHPDVMELFYQVFDKGTIEDAEGKPINFRNTLIIMTSNLASATLIAAFESGKYTLDELCRLIRPEFEQVFSPALIGRMTLIPYLPLQPETLAQIINLKLQQLCQRYQRANEGQIMPTYNQRVVSWVAERCQVKQSGARDIDQVLHQYLLPLLATRMLQSNVEEVLKIDVRKNALVLCTEKGKL